MTPDASETADEPGYAEALAELEAILDDLDDDRLDIDVLAAKVERAAFLVAHCRERIAGARLAVEEVVTDLDGESPG